MGAAITYTKSPRGTLVILLIIEIVAIFGLLGYAAWWLDHRLAERERARLRRHLHDTTHEGWMPEDWP